MEYKQVTGEIPRGPIFARLKSSEIKGSTYTAYVDCPHADVEWEGFLISYVVRIGDEAEDYYVPAAKITSGGRSDEMVLSLDLKEFPFKMTHWAINAVYRKDGEQYYSGVVIPKSYKKNNILFNKNYCKLPDNMIVFQYKIRGSYLGLRYRICNEYDGMGTRWKEELAIVINRLNRRKNKREPGVWIVYEKRCEKAQDNGYYFFRYCMDNDMEKKLDRQIYYVISADSVDYKKVSGYGKNVLKFMSLRYMIYMLRARLLISSDARNHSYVWQNQDSLLVGRIRSKRHVFLGHGVLALKKLNENFTADNMRSDHIRWLSQDILDSMLLRIPLRITTRSS